jgi:hypothetical protein
MGNGSGVSRGDRNRNARLERLRALVPVTNAIAGIDLADAKQMVVVTDHDSKVLHDRLPRQPIVQLAVPASRPPNGAAARSAAPSLDPPTTHTGAAPTRMTGEDQDARFDQLLQVGSSCCQFGTRAAARSFISAPLADRR